MKIPQVYAARNQSDVDCSHHRWTLDTAEDLQLLRAIYARFGGAGDFDWHEVFENGRLDPCSLRSIDISIRKQCMRMG
jgi:spore coat polysaccharide biosynthesis protein SpsF (cytidylyltransferase family)